MGALAPVARIRDLPDHLRSYAEKFLADGTITFILSPEPQDLTHVEEGARVATSLFKITYETQLLSAFYVLNLYASLNLQYTERQITKTQFDHALGVGYDRITALAADTVNKAYALNGNPGRKHAALVPVAGTRVH